MDSTTQALRKHGNPLGRNTNWMIVAAEAVALLILGIYVLVNKSGAGTAILQITSIVLLVAGIVGIFTEFRSGSTDLALYTAFRAGIGVAIGAIGTARWIWDYMPLNALRLILGWGLLAYAVITVAGLLVVRKLGADSWGGLGVGAMTAVLGVILLLNDDASASGTLQLLGIIFLLSGVVLAGIAYLRFQSSQGANAT
ncbi:MAG TPA: DUF308 domain-containing protein [Thermomicrobiales bacterium]|nr:DUF308 domain-containing protein [Thermomicrobiales bacterium]